MNKINKKLTIADVPKTEVVVNKYEIKPLTFKLTKANRIQEMSFRSVTGVCSKDFSHQSSSHLCILNRSLSTLLRLLKIPNGMTIKPGDFLQMRPIIDPGKRDNPALSLAVMHIQEN